MVKATLNKKLFRDLSNLKAQVISISFVVGLGVAVLFGFSSTHRSLEKSRDDFYKSANFSNLLAQLKKAPYYALKELREIEGVTAIEPRLEYDALLALPNVVEPAVGHLVSIPDGRQPQQNQLFIKKGRLPSSLTSQEVVVSENFFKAHELKLGDHFFATLNGRRKKLSIVGVGVTPEYIVAIQPGSTFPDDLHFTVIWMNESALAAAYDMRSSFNSVVFKTIPNVLEQQLIYEIDQVLDKYGSGGAYGRDSQVSAVYVREELKQLRVQATSIPIIFFLVAAFILNVVISRMIRSQRGEIATLKALGYFNISISRYYFRISGLIVLLGVCIGLLIGWWIGDSMIKLYGQFYHFPTLSYDFSYDQIGVSIAISLVTAVIGVYSSLREIFKLQPAEAMRPPSPPSFHKGVFENFMGFQSLGGQAKMMIRGVTTFPKKSLMTGLGLSFVIVLLIGGLFWQDSMGHLITAQYTFVQKETGSVQLTQDVRPESVYEILRFPGVLQAEGYRYASVKARFQNHEQSTVIKGFPRDAKLQGVINSDLQDVLLPQGGVYISRILANQLKVKENDTIDVEFLSGRKEQLELKVTKIVDSFMSSEILTSRKVLAKMMKSDDLVNSIVFRSYAEPMELYTKLKEMPNVLTINYRDSALKMFNETSAKFLLVFAFIFSLFASIIGFGIAYNNMRVALAERDWELATLRILGFTSPEVFRILASEVIFLGLIFVPVGCVLGYLNAQWLVNQMSMDAFQIPFIIEAKTYLFSSLILILSLGMSSWIIYQRVKKLDLVATLKSRG